MLRKPPIPSPVVIPATGSRECAPDDRDDVRGLAFSRHAAPEFCKSFVPKRRRAQRRPGARCTRGRMCKDAHSKTHMSVQVQRKQSGLPCAMVSFALPGDWLSCHRRLRDAKTFRKLGCRRTTLKGRKRTNWTQCCPYIIQSRACRARTRTLRTLRATFPVSFKSCCQNLRTVQPEALSRFATSLSRLQFFSILVCQNAVLVLGIVP
jgi:hypothetical protein